jgi:hypothetical protein
LNNFFILIQQNKIQAQKMSQSTIYQNAFNSLYKHYNKYPELVSMQEYYIDDYNEYLDVFNDEIKKEEKIFGNNTNFEQNDEQNDEQNLNQRNLIQKNSQENSSNDPYYLSSLDNGQNHISSIYTPYLPSKSVYTPPVPLEELVSPNVRSNSHNN